MFKLPDKGSFGYFDRKKKITLTSTILSFLVVFAIYAAGILIYHTNKSIYTVIAALAVLPAARMAISYIMIAPYKSISFYQYQELCSLTDKSSVCRILCDILLASEEKSIIAGTIVVYGNKLMVYSDHKKADIQTVENYLKKILENNHYSFIKMYTDYEQLKKRIQQCISDKEEDASLPELQNICEQIEKKIFSYTI